MIKLEKNTEKIVKRWAESRHLSQDVMVEKIIHWALHYAPKNLDEFDEYGLPYVSKEEEADINRSFNKDYSQEETYTAEQVKALFK